MELSSPPGVVGTRNLPRSVGDYYVITGHFTTAALLASIPYGLGVMSTLVGKHIDQRAFDSGQHQRTLPALLGEQP